jgi:hypothetical protein
MSHFASLIPSPLQTRKPALMRRGARNSPESLATCRIQGLASERMYSLVPGLGKVSARSYCKLPIPAANFA